MVERCCSCLSVSLSISPFPLDFSLSNKHTYRTTMLCLQQQQSPAPPTHRTVCRESDLKPRPTSFHRKGRKTDIHPKVKAPPRNKTLQSGDLQGVELPPGEQRGKMCQAPKAPILPLSFTSGTATGGRKLRCKLGRILLGSNFLKTSATLLRAGLVGCHIWNAFSTVTDTEGSFWEDGSIPC